jgi:hypothetical protein
MGFLPDADGKRIEAQHEAIVSPALWHQVETLRKAGQKSQGGKRGRMTKGRHLLVNGHLRCGGCGAAMIPRTSVRTHDGKPYVYEVYRCYSRMADINSCEQVPVRRQIIDTALVDYLVATSLDFEQTKTRYLEAVSARAHEHAELREQAEREHAQATARLARVKRAFQDGHIEPADWAEQRIELQADIEAAGAKLERLTAQQTQIACGGLQDAEEAVLRRFADLRAAVSGEIASASDVGAIRAVLTRLFERFELRTDRGAEIQADLLEGGNKLVWGGAYLKPIPRAEAILPGLHKLGWEPRKVALELAERDEGDKYSVGLPSTWVVARIAGRTQ